MYAYGAVDRAVTLLWLWHVDGIPTWRGIAVTLEVADFALAS
jgi:hypothetical protein